MSVRRLIVLVLLLGLVVLLAGYALSRHSARIGTQRGLPSDTVAPVATDGASRLAAEPLAQQVSALRWWVLAELRLCHPEWSADEQSEYADVVAQAIADGAGGPLSAAQIQAFREAFHELASNLCFHNGPDGIRRVEHSWMRTRTWTVTSRAPTEQAGLAWMVRLWLRRERLSPEARGLLDHQLATFDQAAEAAARNAIQCGLDAGTINAMVAEARETRDRARGNALWPWLKEPLPAARFAELLALVNDWARFQNQWQSGAPRTLVERALKVHARTRSHAAFSTYLSSFSAAMANWGDLPQWVGSGLLPSEETTVTFWLAGHDTHYSTLLGDHRRLAPQGTAAPAETAQPPIPGL